MSRFKGDQNIGMHTAGDVRADKIVLNVGGQLHSLVELDDQELADKRRSVFNALRKRRSFASLPTTLGTLLVCVMWIGIIRMPAAGADGMPAGMATASLLIGVAGAVWLMMHTHFGAWRRQQLQTVRQLEILLALIDAELDVRAAPVALTPAGWLRELLASFRP